VTEIEQAERYFEIWREMILSGMDKHEAKVRADDQLREELDEHILP
jgi:hypothetical protein